MNKSGKTSAILAYSTALIYGLEKAILEAPLNNGTEPEQYSCVNSSALDNASEPIVHDLQKSRLKTDRRNINKMWGLVRKHLLPGLPIHPDNGFIAIVINHLYEEDVKNGERITHEFFVKCFRQGLEEYYKIPFKKSL